jgi:GEVED domain-containing protein
MKKSKIVLLFALIALIGAASISFGDWDPEDPYKMHFPQMPNFDGYDVCLHEQALADDFECTETGTIDDIHLWVSFMDDIEFNLYDQSIWNISIRAYDISAPGNIGAILWQFTSGSIAVRQYGLGQQGWHCPSTQTTIPNDHDNIWQVNFTNLEEPMIQEAGTMYWLVVQVNVADWPPAVGWKTADLASYPPPHTGQLFGSYAKWAVPPIGGNPWVWNPISIPSVGFDNVDLAFVITGTPINTDELDFGDAPDGAAAPGYPTLLANSGANHLIDLTKPWLGTQSDFPDPEADGQPDATATGDDNDANGDDEDGVVFPLLVSGTTVNATVEVFDPSGTGGGGVVEIWIDWDISTSWEAGELVFSGNLGHGTNTVPIMVPAGLTAGTSFARCRISIAGTGSVTGGAPDGEVEDYEVTIDAEEPEPELPLKFQQLPLNGPEYFGHDELSTAYRDPDNPVQFEGCYMADDFADLVDTPVIQLKWWGSYLENEIMEPIVRFLIAFETDIPAFGQPGDIDYVASHPGEVLQTEIVHLSSTVPLNPGEYSETIVPGSGGAPCYETLFEYEAVLRNPFPQDPNTVYWLKIVALIDDENVLARVKPALQLSGLSLCQFLNLTNAQQGLQDPVTRWGWHNRDYTIRDPYASTPPAVVPGEHLAGITSQGAEVWHFQDDAVSGELIIDESDPIMPFVDQYTWQEEYYQYIWPLCTGVGVDGPQDIELFSKDLAFELYTAVLDCYQEVGRDITHPAEYADWITYGKPVCWCYPRQCHGDADGKKTGSAFLGYQYVSVPDLNVLAASWLIKEPKVGKTWPGILSITGPAPDFIPGICADFARDVTGSAFLGYQRVSVPDLNAMAIYWLVKEPKVGKTWPGVPADCVPGNRTP